ncbi:MAG: hypothetical protein EOP52_08220 [Sphingobacteriales bacterium]|nr:MAG: hypothetical protein EOP52_08220 [Sphingobacteriales bacterium]
MKFKIDTTDLYTRILPADAPLSDSMAAQLVTICQKQQLTGSGNCIIDLSSLPDSPAEDTEAVFKTLLQLHEAQYNAGHSLIFTGAGTQLLAQFKQAELHHILNLTPTLPEAIDMVNMEIMERDLFNEDEP